MVLSRHAVGNLQLDLSFHFLTLLKPVDFGKVLFIINPNYPAVKPESHRDLRAIWGLTPLEPAAADPEQEKVNQKGRRQQPPDNQTAEPYHRAALPYP